MAYTQRIFYHRPTYDSRYSVLRYAIAIAAGVLIGFMTVSIFT